MKITDILTYGGLILLAVGALIPLLTFDPQGIAYKIIFTAGAALTLIGRVTTPTMHPVLRVRRLLRLQTWSAMFFAVAAFFMWYSADPRDWLVFTIAGAAVQCYVSIVLPMAMRKSPK